MSIIRSSLIARPQPPPARCARHLVCERGGRIGERAAVTNRPSLGLSPQPPEAQACGGARDRSGASFNPNSCLGLRARTSKEGNGSMTQAGRIGGIDIAKHSAAHCIRSLGLQASCQNTPQGRRELIAWLRANGAGLAVIEASGGYEQSWAAALRAAGIAVRVVDPKRVRYFAKSAGRLAKNDPIDAAMIAWFAETFAVGDEPADDAERAALDRLVSARALLVKLATALRQLGEHQQPPGVRPGCAARNAPSSKPSSCTSPNSK